MIIIIILSSNASNFYIKIDYFYNKKKKIKKKQRTPEFLSANYNFNSNINNESLLMGIKDKFLCDFFIFNHRFVDFAGFFRVSNSYITHSSKIHYFSLSLLPMTIRNSKILKIRHIRINNN